MFNLGILGHVPRELTCVKRVQIGSLPNSPSATLHDILQCCEHGRTLCPERRFTPRFALLHCLLVRGPLTDVLEPAQNVRIRAEVARHEHTIRRGRVGAHNICGSEIVASEPLCLAEAVVEDGKHSVGLLRDDAQPRVVGGQLHHVEEQVARHGCLQAAVGKVEEEDVVGIVLGGL